MVNDLRKKGSILTGMVLIHLAATEIVFAITKGMKLEHFRSEVQVKLIVA